MDKYWFVIIYSITALGTLGLFLLLPRGRRPAWPQVGAVLAGLSLAALIAAVVRRSAGEIAPSPFWFAAIAAAALFSAVMMITRRRCLYAALWFVLTNLSVAALLLQQQAQFLAVAMVIVYAGAILVVYLFVLMLTRQEPLEEYETTSRTPFMAVLVGFVLLGGLLQVVFYPLPAAAGETVAATEAQAGTALAVGQELFEYHVVAFETAGVLLLIAAVGAIAILKIGLPRRSAAAGRDSQTTAT